MSFSYEAAPLISELYSHAGDAEEKESKHFAPTLTGCVTQNRVCYNMQRVETCRNH